MKEFVDLSNARLDEQRKVMEKIVADGKCPFCAENLFSYHKKPILKETPLWILTENQWPYNNTKLQLLAIYKPHAERLSELPDQAGAELLELFKWAEKEYGLPGGGFAMRFGDTKHSGGTVRHLHAQFIQPDLEKQGYEAVRFKIG